MKKRGIVHEPDRKVDLRREMRPDRVGAYPSVEVKLVLELATAIHEAESDGAAVSWSAQERAQVFYNEHGFVAALDEKLRLEAIRAEQWSNDEKPRAPCTE
jgi:hypothetical protein